ncbi:hypothetical protein PRIPAC_81137 [Pristionchus pacificus]|uniref:Uncharacterized protein n=1 Tax=Pristionchus pacificus TaxID=54126 RepID=A0A2A6CQP0_PRIPA|nr:hypothetical protein PRIPAC_81137 [Pristionchus pacificus]|eukprot:PDM80377.1 hypothetical protein PRIPAC_32956 [Pristionchus pacificus]
MPSTAVHVVLLSSLPLAAIACIPTKHPEPGIPATPGPVNTGCAQFGAATVAILDGSPQPGS